METLPSPLSSRPERSAVEGSAVSPSDFPNPPSETSTPKQKCHPDRGAVEGSAERPCSAPNPPSKTSTQTRTILEPKQPVQGWPTNSCQSKREPRDKLQLPHPGKRAAKDIVNLTIPRAINTSIAGISQIGMIENILCLHFELQTQSLIQR